MSGGFTDPGSGWIERVRQLERRETQAEQRIARIEELDQQPVIVERLSSALLQIAELRAEIKWLRRTIIGLGSVIAAAAAIIAQSGAG